MSDDDPWKTFADEQITAPLKARMRAAKTRAERREAKKATDKETQHARWREWHDKRLKSLMSGKYHEAARELSRFLEKTTMESAQDIVSFVARGPWHDADGDTRFLVLGLVDSRIMMLRTAEGLAPFDDAIPFLDDEAPTAFEIIKAMLNEKGEI